MKGMFFFAGNAGAAAPFGDEFTYFPIDNDPSDPAPITFDHNTQRIRFVNRYLHFLEYGPWTIDQMTKVGVNVIPFFGEFRLLPSETADDYGTLTALRGLIGPWVNDIPDDELESGSCPTGRVLQLPVPHRTKSC
jgi:hypothetical protein